MAILRRFVDADHWEAEDVVGRLGMIAHAALLHAGFVPYGAEPPSGHLLKMPAGKTGTSLYLSRRYTAPQLAHRKDADAAVLMLCTTPGSDDVALIMYLTTDIDVRSAYRERLGVATITPLLSRALDDTEPRGSRICWSLADGVCWGLFVKLCHRNGLPLTGFTSLPDDVKVEILKRLKDGEDLARVECTSRQLRRLVAECDGELWKPLYEAHREFLKPLYEALRELWKSSYDLFSLRLLRRWCRPFLLDDAESSEDVAVSWKEKYVMRASRHRLFLDSFPLIVLPPIRSTSSPWIPAWLLSDPPEPKIVAGGKNACGHHRKVARNDYNKKRHGAGAIHSPSSRYRWKHR
ncbi:uncharacterized protein LOC133907227 [Phragmites australis]|uniref:uncharacterized protein LOC133907227 n=1 Tax=Phragmites australis TaxID=29695 RepID=UPI002D797D94|nr:uncharacterized protein LOC133907227 [Phragmites australis]